MSGVDFDVLVLGGGPAGAIAARGLAQRGLGVAVVEPRAVSEPRIGEVLSSAAGAILRELGLWERFLAQGHAPSHAVRSIWGSDEPFERSLLFDPHGSGFHLDRSAFDRLLLEGAEDAGATVLRRTSARSVKHAGHVFTLELAGLGPGRPRREVRARFVVDATGRRAWLGRRLGAARRADDRQVAWSWRYLPATAGDPIEPLNSVEAVQDGWWYSAPLPSGELLVVFMSDADLGGRAALERMPHDVRRRVGSSTLRGAAHAWPAASALVVRAPHDERGWLAAGDASAAFDPLAGYGICFALRSGQHAAHAAHAFLEGDVSVRAAYESHIAATYAAYLRERAVHYGLESRFADAPFWRRRSAAGNGRELTRHFAVVP